MDALIPVVTSFQMKNADAETIRTEPISSIELMERASGRLYNALINRIQKNQKILVLCGPGNNGGDGLCIARLLHTDRYACTSLLCLFGKKQSPDNELNAGLLKAYRPSAIHEPKSASEIDFNGCDIIVDCLFGTGLQKALEGEFQLLLERVNRSGKKVISIDMPSGLSDTTAMDRAVFIQADETLTIQAPKPSFFYPENQIRFEIIDAGIRIRDTTEMKFLSPQSPWKEAILDQIPGKPEFGHKGNSGHVLIAGGNKGMYGAVALAANASVLHGAGLTTVMAPSGSRLYMAAIPKAMHLPAGLDADHVNITDLSRFTTLALGPGLNTSENSRNFLMAMLKKWDRPVLLDADALNLLAGNKDIWPLVKPGSILTPHPGEFKRLFGGYNTGEEKFSIGKREAKSRGIFILAKDKYSALFCPDGEIIVNGSGGPELSQGGSGDTLTGAIAAWWGRTSDAKIAAMAGMYLCGLDITK